MRPIRRNDLSPRLELTPLLDVVFLLLTFFIYSMLVMVNAKVLPVTLLSVGKEAKAATGELNVVTIDRAGAFYFNRDRVSAEELDKHLRELAQSSTRATVYLAVEAEGDIDRGPLFVRLLEQIRRSGISNFAIVGQPQEAGAAP